MGDRGEGVKYINMRRLRAKKIFPPCACRHRDTATKEATYLSHFLRAEVTSGLQLLPVLLVALQRGRVTLCALLQVADEQAEGRGLRGREGGGKRLFVSR